MERNPSRLVEQLQGAQLRQRKVIQQLQADNTRLLSDLVDIRQERDAFREEAARVRRENTELRNRLEEVLTRCQDLRRERATLVRSANSETSHVRSPYMMEAKMLTGQTESSPVAETTTVDVTVVGPVYSPVTALIVNDIQERAASPKSRPQLIRELPDPFKLTSPPPDHVIVGPAVRSTSTVQGGYNREYRTG